MVNSFKNGKLSFLDFKLKGKESFPWFLQHKERSKTAISGSLKKVSSTDALVQSHQKRILDNDAVLDKHRRSNDKLLSHYINSGRKISRPDDE